MADGSAIEWTDATWNPVRGCTRVSEGCRNCYAEVVAARFSGAGQPYHGFAERDRPGSKWTGRVDLVRHKLDEPLDWRKPRKIFVNSMSDLFHEALPWDDIAVVYGTAIAAVHLRGHTFQILTKRPERMREMLADPSFWEMANSTAGAIVMDRVDPHDRRSDDARATLDDYGPGNPPPGIWLGTSIEDQATAAARIPHLLAAPAKVRFLSCEPLLGPVDLGRIPFRDQLHLKGWEAEYSCLTDRRRTRAPSPELDGFPKIHWVICGGESGKGSRPMHPDWARALRDQCAAAGTAFFFKQWGDWSPHQPRAGGDLGGDVRAGRVRIVHPSGRDDAAVFDATGGRSSEAGSRYMARVGKRAAGRHLDGRTWDEVPGRLASDAGGRADCADPAGATAP